MIVHLTLLLALQYFPTTFMPTGSPTFIGAWGTAYQGPLPKYVYVPGSGGKWVNDGWGNPQWVEDKGYLVPYIAPPTDPPTTFMPTTFPPVSSSFVVLSICVHDRRLIISNFAHLYIPSKHSV